MPFLFVRCAALLCACVALAAAQDDPFADLGLDLGAFMNDRKKAKADKEAKTKAFKEAEKVWKEGKQMVADLEKQLREAQLALQKNETRYKEAKESKQKAEKAMLDTLTGIAQKAQRAAEDKMEEMKRGPGLGRVEPEPGAEVVLWSERHQLGQSVRLQCCGDNDVEKLLRDSGIVAIRSVTVPSGIRATFRASSALFSKSEEAEEQAVFDAYGDLAELDGLISDYRQTCCASIELVKGVMHYNDTSVILYEEPDFQGESQAYLEGDYGEPSLKQVGSIRVPAGMRATARSLSLSDDRASSAFGSILGIFKRDSRTFPQSDTASNQNRGPREFVKSLSVRRILPSDMHGLWVYNEPLHEGRAQFFEAGEHFMYPETWPEIRSVKPTNWTSAQLFATAGVQVVTQDMPEIPENFSHPHSLDVSAICEPSDFCGEYGRCVQPQKCSCSSSRQGERCHLQIPDETSAVICEQNAIVVGEPLSCRLLLKRDNEACNATSLFLRVDLANSAESAGELFGDAVIKTGSYSRRKPQDADMFAFDVVFNTTGEFAKPFEFSVFNKPALGMFTPKLEVLDRCDTPGTMAKVTCDQDKKTEMAQCALTLLLVNPQGQSSAMRCPAHDVRVFLADGEALDVSAETRSAAASRFLFAVSAIRALKGGGPAQLRVEVQHGFVGIPLSLLIVATGLGLPAAPAISGAKALLQAGRAEEALASLEACAARPCRKLRADLLLQTGDFEEAEHAYEALGDGLAQERAAKGKRAAASAKEASADPKEVLRLFRTAVELAPLSSSLRLLRSEAALQAGRFELAAEDARHARSLGTAASDAPRVLEVLGRALLAMGVSGPARQNFRGCAELLTLVGGDGAACRELAAMAQHLEQQSAELETVHRKELWAVVVSHAEGIQREHAAFPWFKGSFWDLSATSALCIANSALNQTEAALAPCGAVVAAEAAQSLLPADDVLRCHMALAEALERHGSLAEALRQAKLAEELLGEYGGEDGLASWAAEILLLRERLARNFRKAGGEEQEKNETKNETKKKKDEKPKDHYEVLGLARNATLAEIKGAYRKLALKYHPDKNPDPEAVQIFLDVQQAYQVLSDPDLRRRYNAGQSVDDEAGGKAMKPMRYKIIEIDRERGIAKVWWYDPNTGEEGFMEMEVDKEKEKPTQESVRRTLRDHCCLPRAPGDGAEEDSEGDDSL